VFTRQRTCPHVNTRVHAPKFTFLLTFELFVRILGDSCAAYRAGEEGRGEVIEGRVNGGGEIGKSTAMKGSAEDRQNNV
jgi:hypothetical protein